ncbi:carboxypeptidase regulatory-like domain-containing protein [Hymenobacter properus]|uniref:Carboxypeptidase regulatory-like domain-containing protein n=1 Tax=Hymenobacter properus TaxID=2791026 RepID=A0A931FKT3_9BACT|nr:carboxypeptidase regulatory-like domain-containing protein [Hymenobacter properus]MBF9140039.1 carboxypeptidase regulatory-like domain-containing protein [Hymenobacter properus]MBR7718846.1 carboxypeptidase regulatory-like domain-containing protein [Microvirga sp. SRT04]
MPRPLRFSQRYLLLLGLALFPLLTGLVACSKKNSPDPASVVGAVEGTVAPAGSINLVLLAAPGASSSQAAQPDGNGHFKFDNVNAGNYEVSFRENSGYLPPSPRAVTVTAGTTASVGTIAVSGSTGAVEGTVTPVNSIYLVVLTTPGSTNGPATTPDVNGYFKFNNVAAGTYNVSFRENSGYVQPSPRTVTVTTGATASVGTITVSPTGPTSASLRGTVSWSRSGTNYNSSTVGGSVSLTNGAPSSFSLLATSQNGNIAEIMGLNLPYFSATPTLSASKM